MYWDYWPRPHYVAGYESAFLEEHPDYYLQPTIFDDFDPVKYLALMARILPQQINWVLREGVEAFYHEKWIPKASGRKRLLLVPTGPLQAIQKQINKNVLSTYHVHPCAHGFVPGRSVISNALVHSEARCVYALDIKDAFSAVTGDEVLRLLYRSKVGDYKVGWQVANLIVQLCTFSHPALGHNFCLPQGAPTSPAFFNLACGKMDYHLAHFASHLGGRYTRYADNLYLSLPRKFREGEIAVIRKIIARTTGFQINEEKTRMMLATGHSVLKFPGVAISAGRVRLSKQALRELRGDIFYASRFGEEERLRGLLAWARQVYGNNLPQQLTGALPLEV